MDEKIQKLMENEAFVAELETVKTMEEAVALFAREGVTVTEAELNEWLSGSESETLSEEDLDEVAGGSIAGWIGYQLGKALTRPTCVHGGRNGGRKRYHKK